MYAFLCKGHVQVLIGAQFLLVSTSNYCTSSSLSVDYIDVNSRQSSTIYDSPKTMKLEGSILCVCFRGFFFNQIYSDNNIRCKVLFWDLILNFYTLLCFSADCTKVTPFRLCMIYISGTTVKLEGFTLYISFNGKHSDLLLRCTLLLGIYFYFLSSDLVLQLNIPRSIPAHCLLVPYMMLVQQLRIRYSLCFSMCRVYSGLLLRCTLLLGI